MQSAVIDCKYIVMYADVNDKMEITNVAILRYLQEAGGLQTKRAFGSLLTPKGPWILLNWRIKKFNNLYWNEEFVIKTWPAKHKGPFSIRNYEMYNEKNELVLIAESKWVIVDPESGSIVRNIEDVISHYTELDKMLFEDDGRKLREPDNLEKIYNYVVQRRDLDTNHHVNNIKYLEFVYEALPLEVYNKSNFSNIEIMYKHSALLNDKIDIYMNVENLNDDKSEYTFVLKNKEQLSAIIKLS